MVAISWIIYGIHKGFSLLGFGEGSSLAWPISIIGLVFLIRIALLPVYSKQIRAMQASQVVAPEIRRIQAKYKGKKDQVSQRKMIEETQAVYKSAGTSPLASCFPVLVQIPIFLSLFRTLEKLPYIANGTYEHKSIGPITDSVADVIQNSSLFGAPLSSTFVKSAQENNYVAMSVTGLIVLVMVVSQFLSMKYITLKNMTAPLEGQQAQMMNMMRGIMLYFVPFMLLASGVVFPLGTVIYWFTNNIWSLAQQAYMVYNHPNEGTPAWEKKQERQRQKRIKMGLPPEEPKDSEEILETMSHGQRVQPVGKKRAKKSAMAPLSAEEIAAANKEKVQSAREIAEEIAARQQVIEEAIKQNKTLEGVELEQAVKARVEKNRQEAKRKASSIKSKKRKRK